MALTGTVSLGISFTDVNTANSAGQIQENIILPQTPLTTATKWSDGSGSYAATKQWSVSSTLTASTVDYDLTNLTASRGLVSFSRVKLILLVMKSTTDGQYMKVGAAASNQFYPFFDAATSYEKVYAGGIFLKVAPLAQGVNPWTVSGGAKNLRLDAGAYTLAYDLVIVGV